ncbi:DNA mismatch endonuclease Vsr [Erythrobacter sp. sf7]|uniref:Very short patch repair endonuclease n=1 Tax=Erythrobacter fulvus TaxID=2987523 RepID=A0ABT5JMU2_9SPHN|nr:DNA mismatch endonuclease Vsr [Erythrobacter fulvus]MDC8753831.1 DNA mismatch endonuclease Vsr [Erythrobacter fulvus]
MTDVHDPATRSRNMAAVKARDTKPELMIRKALHAAGLRYRLNVRDLPGKPDVVLPRYRAVVLVRGCFWHRHECDLFRRPESRTEFWREKLNANAARDAKAAVALEMAGWRQAVIWECALKGRKKRDFQDTMQRLIAWIRSDEQAITIGGE